jgi:MFS family permease
VTDAQPKVERNGPRMEQLPRSEAAGARAPVGGSWAGLASVLTGLFMIAVDVSIVNVAAPRIRDDLGLSGPALVLVVSGYSLVYAMLLITCARLGGDFGHRRVFLIGLCWFTGASLLCGLAHGAGMLITARLAQGAGGAMMGPQVLSIIQTQFAGDAQRRGVALYATVLAAGTVVGQVAGGLFVAANLFGASWRPAFFINVPVGLAVLIATRRSLAETRAATKREPDVVGVVLVSAAVLAVMAPLVLGQEEGWPAWTYLSLALSVVLTGSTLVYLRNRRAKGRDALVDVEIFDSAKVRQGLSSLFTMQVAYGGVLFAYALHFQAGLGYSPLRAGLIFTAFAAAFSATSINYRRLPASTHKWVPVGALLVLAVGYLSVGGALAAGAWHNSTLLLLAVSGGAFGASFSPMVAVTVANTPTRLAAEASGLVGTVVQLGFVAGVASLGTWYLHGEPRGAVESGAAFAQVTIGAAVLVAVSTAQCLRQARAA